MKRYGLHLGLNGVNPSAYGGWPGWLQACCRDATTMAEAFARAGYDTSALFNENATAGAVADRLMLLAQELEAGDSLVLSYSGHGGRAGAWTLSGYQETICLYDGQMTDVTFLSYLAGFKPGVNIAVLLDSCHSGGMDKAAPGWRLSRAMPLNVEARVVPTPPGRATLAANVLFMTACQADETALDGVDNGAFTDSLLASLAGKGQTWQDWYRATCSLMALKFPSQHPQLVTHGPALFTTQPVFCA